MKTLIKKEVDLENISGGYFNRTRDVIIFLSLGPGSTGVTGAICRTNRPLSRFWRFF